MKQLNNVTIESCVLRTIIYSDIFDYPLTLKELHGKIHGNKKTTQKDTERALDQLVAKGKLENQGKYYFLPGKGEIVKLRKKREKYTKEKLTIARQSANLIKLIPTVKFVGVTGSVAAGNAKRDDDVDLFIISSPGWLWTTRLLVTLLVSLFSSRRRPGDKNVKDKICLNMFVDQSRLDAFDQNLFTAYELVQLKPLVDRNNTYQKLLAANQWAKNYLPTNPKFQNLTPNPVNYFFRSEKIVDKLFRKIQLWWMRERLTTETVKPWLIAFHPKDIGQEVMIEYKERLT